MTSGSEKTNSGNLVPVLTPSGILWVQCQRFSGPSFAADVPLPVALPPVAEAATAELASNCAKMLLESSVGTRTLLGMNFGKSGSVNSAGNNSNFGSSNVKE